MMMKKRERKGQTRRRVADDSGDEEGLPGDQGGEEEVKRRTLEEIREEQKQRKARAGLQAASSLETGEEGAQGGKKKKKNRKKGSDDEGDENDEEEQKAKEKTISERMDANFTGIKYMAKREDDVAHKKIMEDYIKEKMGIKQDEADPQESGAAGKMSKREKLLQITREIQPDMPQETAYGDEGIGEGAPIAYSTGIAEVALPIDVKLRNIEDTERARRALEEKHRRGHAGPDYDQSIIGNLTTNYHLFRRDHAQKMREKDEREKGYTDRGRGGGGGGRDGGRFGRGDGRGGGRGGGRGDGRGGGRGDGYRGGGSMTDDAVYERFKKRARR